MILRPDVIAASLVQVDAPDLTKRASAGITTMLVDAAGRNGARAERARERRRSRQKIRRSATSPRHGAARSSANRRWRCTWRSRTGPSRFRAYPESLMGSIAFVRQAFLDARHYQVEQQYYAQGAATARRGRPTIRALAAMQPAVDGKLPVAFEVQEAREIRRALAMAKDLKLDPIITGALEAGDTTAELKAQNARVIVSVDYPVRSKALAPDADEPLRVLRAARERAEDGGGARSRGHPVRVRIGRAQRAARFREERRARRQGRTVHRCGRPRRSPSMRRRSPASAIASARSRKARSRT